MDRQPLRLTRAVAAALLAGLIGSTVAGAQTQPEPDGPDPMEVAADGKAIEALLDSVGMGAAWRSATGLGSRARALPVELDEATAADLAALVVAVDELVRIDDERITNTRLIVEASIAIDRALEAEQNALVARNIARHELKVINALLRIIAVDLFEVAYDDTDEMFTLDPRTLGQVQRTREITESTVEEMVARKLAAEAELAGREQALVEAIVYHELAVEDHEALVDHQSELTMARARLDEDVRRFIVDGARQWVLSEISGVSNVTPRTIDAYFGAEQAMALERPRCRVSWATIAAVSAVEGRHGTHAGAVVGLDGVSDPRIIGMALDGEAVDNYGNPVANIADTDGGYYDDDRVLDRAVGPLQFIPQEWERWRRDGDGDGVTDPHDIDDAAIGAAAYLCNYGSLRSWENWNRAIHAYNHSNAYVASVKGNLDRLARAPIPPPEDGLVWQALKPRGAYVEPPPEPEPEDGALGPDEAGE